MFLCTGRRKKFGHLVFKFIGIRIYGAMLKLFVHAIQGGRIIVKVFIQGVLPTAIEVQKRAYNATIIQKQTCALKVLVDSDYVCNVVNTVKQRPPKASSWKMFWEIETKENWPSKCSMCSKNFDQGRCRSVGGHVYIKGQKDGVDQYIIPICTGCNNNRKIDYNDGYPKRTQWENIGQNTSAALVPKHVYI